MGDEQVAFAFFHGLHHQAGGVDVQKVVRVDELQVFARRALDGDVARAGYAGVGLVDDDDARVHACVHAADFQTGVVGAVVDEQNLQVCVALALDAFQAGHQVDGRVVDRHDDGDERGFHTGGASLQTCRAQEMFMPIIP